nr:MAG TPA: hypothetical protein [Caudoviricetes sp.]
MGFKRPEVQILSPRLREPLKSKDFSGFSFSHATASDVF